MAEETVPVFDYQIQIPLQVLTERASGIRAETLSVPVDIFVRNLRNLHLTLAVPYLLLGVDNVLFNLFAEKSGEMWHRVFSQHLDQEREIKMTAEALLREAVREMQETKQTGLDFAQVRDSLGLVLESSAIRRSLIGLLRAAVVSCWAAYEILVTDVWVASLNSYPRPFARNALDDSHESGSATKHKTLQTRLLLQYDFDIQNRMGTILQERFKFTSTSDICTAYVAAFGKRYKDRIKGIVDREDLKFLESARHNIAHRAGVIDEKFLSRVRSYADFDAVEGHDLVMPGTFVSRLIGAAMESGFDLVEFVDRQIDNWEKAKVLRES